MGGIDDGRAVPDAEKTGNSLSSMASSHPDRATGGSSIAPIAEKSGVLDTSDRTGHSEEAVRSATTIVGLARTGSFVMAGVPTSAVRRPPPIAKQGSAERRLTRPTM